MHIATTRLMTRHAGSGMTIMETLKDGFDYGKNPDKTRNGDLILAYECDPDTADAEFLLSKAKYKAITGREQKRDNDASANLGSGFDTVGLALDYHAAWFNLRVPDVLCRFSGCRRLQN